MPLWIQIPVADFDGMIEVEMALRERSYRFGMQGQMLEARKGEFSRLRFAYNPTTIQFIDAF